MLFTTYIPSPSPPEDVATTPWLWTSTTIVLSEPHRARTQREHQNLKNLDSGSLQATAAQLDRWQKTWARDEKAEMQ